MSALPDPTHHDTPPALDPRFIAGANAQWQQRKNDATPRGVAVLESFYAARAQNAELWDIEGRRYIDFGIGIAVLNTGHRHPRVVEAVRAQLELFTHTAYQVVPYASYVALAERINERVPGAWPKKTAFFTTGAEAVENAVKIARAATGRPGIIAFGGGFHGRTYFGMALTGKVVPYKAGFGPFPGEVYHAPFPDLAHGITVQHALDGVRALFKNDIEARRVAAFIFEPVQGEGGFLPAPREFVAGLREIADQHGILLIADEIQTGFARTGKLFAIEHHDAAIDLVTFAKSLAGGLPLSGVCGRAALMDACEPGGLGGTYAGNPLAVAAAHAVLDVIDDEGLVDRAVLLGDRLRTRLEGAARRVPQIADIRGPGSMIGVEFLDPSTRQPLPDFAKRVQALALERGLILLVCGSYGNVIRFLYPLTTEDGLFAEALDIVEAALINA
jgi:4-aminobutyrate aminotransferase